MREEQEAFRKRLEDEKREAEERAEAERLEAERLAREAAEEAEREALAAKTPTIEPETPTPIKRQPTLMQVNMNSPKPEIKRKASNNLSELRY